MGGVAVGSIVAPAIVAAIGPRLAFAVVGSILPLLTLLAYRRLVAVDRVVAPARELGLIENVPMFAPLSLVTKERVAAHFVPLQVAAGELVIRAGDRGDRFYIVGDGELDGNCRFDALRARARRFPRGGEGTFGRARGG